MAVQITKEFLTNVTLFILAIVALGLSIGAIMKPCKDKFGACTALGEPCYHKSDICCDGATCNEDKNNPTHAQVFRGHCRLNGKTGPCADEGEQITDRAKECCSDLIPCGEKPGVCKKKCDNSSSQPSDDCPYSPCSFLTYDETECSSGTECTGVNLPRTHKCHMNAREGGLCLPPHMHHSPSHKKPPSHHTGPTGPGFGNGDKSVGGKGGKGSKPKSIPSVVPNFFGWDGSRCSNASNVKKQYATREECMAAHKSEPEFGPGGEQDSHDLTWLWITLGSVGGVALLATLFLMMKKK